MKCKFNLRAPNGKNSQLFKDISKAVQNPNEAVDLYYYTKSEEFKAMYGKGKVDDNGEPIYDRFSEEAYLDDVDFNKQEMNHEAEALKNILDRVPDIIRTVDHRIKLLSRDKNASEENKATIKELKELKDDFATRPLNSSLPRFVEMSNVHARALKNRAQKAYDNKESDIRELSSYYKISESYRILSEVKQSISDNKDLADIFSASTSKINMTIGHMDTVYNLYIRKSKDYISQELHKRDSSWTPKDYYKALNQTTRDTQFMEQMLEYVGDSQDKVLSMAAQVLMEADHKTRREAVDFAKDLQESLEILENSSSEKGDKIFQDMIVEDSNGELHIVDLNAVHTDGENTLHNKMAAKLKTIKADPNKMQFLSFYQDMTTKLDASLPKGSQIGTRLPSVLRSDWERVEGKSIKDKASMLGDSIKKKFLRSNLDMERGQVLDSTGKPVKKIPTFYTQRYDSIDYEKHFNKIKKDLLEEGKTEVQAEELAAPQAEKLAIQDMAKYVSRDLANSLQSFHAMATNYANKNEVVHVLESISAVVSSDAREYTLVDSGGRVQKNAATKRAQTIKGSQSKSAQYLEQFLDVQLYGQKEKDLGFADILGVKIDANKALRALNSYTGIAQMTGNLLAGLGNVTFGEYSNFMEAVGGEHFKVKDVVKASGTYKQHLGGALTDIGKRTPDGLLNLLDAHYNILQSYGGETLSTSERTKARRLFKTDSAFFISNVGEHFMQMRGGMAIMSNIQMFSESGTSLGSLLDQHSVKDGKLVIKEGLHIKNEEGELVPFDTNEQNKVSNKIGAVMRQAHGNYSTQTANAMQADARLALIAKFRGWMYEGYMKRFKKAKYNHILNQEQTGFYRDAASQGFAALKILAQDLKKMNFQVSKENWGNLTPHEKANMRRALLEMSAIIASSAAASLLAGAGKIMEDEYDSDSFLDRLILGNFAMLEYQANRFHTEVFAYANPKEALKLMRSPAASLSIIESMISMVEQTIDDPFAVYDAGWKKGTSKLIYTAGKLVPFYKQIQTLNADGIADRGFFLTN